MLNAIKFLVGSSQHVFPEISNLFPGKTTYVTKKVIKIKYNTLLWLLLFFTFLLSYERLKTYFPTSAQEISAILGHSHFEAAITQKRLEKQG